MGLINIIFWPFRILFGGKRTSYEELQRAAEKKSPIAIRYERAMRVHDYGTAGRLKRRVERYDRRIERLKRAAEREKKEKVREAETREERKELKKEYKKVIEAVGK